MVSDNTNISNLANLSWVLGFKAHPYGNRAGNFATTGNLIFIALKKQFLKSSQLEKIKN